MNAAEAAAVIDRAVEAEYDPDLIRLVGIISGRDELLSIPTEELGSLEDRLQLLVKPEALREMGEAWIDAGLRSDAIEYIREARRRIEGWLRKDLDVVELPSCEHSLQRCVANAWTEQCDTRRIYRRPVGFREPPPPKCTIPPPERDGDRDHRKTSRVLAESTRSVSGFDVNIYRTRVGREPQVTRKDEREWESEFDERARIMKRRDGWRSEVRRLTRRRRYALEDALDNAARHRSPDRPEPSAAITLRILDVCSLQNRNGAEDNVAHLTR
jgi:hypothetical protein